MDKGKVPVPDWFWSACFLGPGPCNLSRTGCREVGPRRCGNEQYGWSQVTRGDGPFIPSPPNGFSAASYLVDPASSHMLVSKIKPCMSKYKLLHSETANGSLNQLWFLRSYNPTWITVVILELIHATKLRPSGKSAFIRSKPIGSSGPSHW